MATMNHFSWILGKWKYLNFFGLILYAANRSSVIVGSAFLLRFLFLLLGTSEFVVAGVEDVAGVENVAGVEDVAAVEDVATDEDVSAVDSLFFSSVGVGFAFLLRFLFLLLETSEFVVAVEQGVAIDDVAAGRVDSTILSVVCLFFLFRFFFLRFDLEASEPVVVDVVASGRIDSSILSPVDNSVSLFFCLETSELNMDFVVVDEGGVDSSLKFTHRRNMMYTNCTHL